MVETAKTEYDGKSRGRKHTGMRQSLERLSSRIMYYGKVMDTLAQHHPEHLGTLCAEGHTHAELLGPV